jgi:CIC family chloride channel protein
VPAEPDIPQKFKPLLLRTIANLREFIDQQRIRMSRNDAMAQLAALAVIVGIVAGSLSIIFRLLVTGALTSSILDDYSASFESLSAVTRFLLCAGGGLLIGVIFQNMSTATRQIGIVHVLERLAYHHGRMPLKNAVAQFLGAALCMVTGQSVGREGPTVHLGAAAGATISDALKIPHNAGRILIGCGVASAIGAGFNTPLAGVIFAMEVVLMEYTILGFTPVIIASLTATSLARIMFGDAPAFTAPSIEWASIGELPYVMLMGVVIGLSAAAFVKATVLFSHLIETKPYWMRVALAGLITGVLAIPVPQIMGIGYDTVSLAILGQISMAMLILIFFAKLVATSASIGLGMPGGLIGPALLMGACIGSSMGMMANDLVGGLHDEGLYALLGACAMMGAALHAPLAALVAILELSGTHSVILPAMIAVVTALISKRVPFGLMSIYRVLMRERGLDYRNSPMAQALRRIGVASVMDKSVSQMDRIITVDAARTILETNQRWIMAFAENGQASLLPAADLAIHLSSLETGNHEIDLLSLPAMREDSTRVTILETLQEAHEAMEATGAELLYVTGAHGKSANRIYGVITREHIERHYKL